MSNIFFIRGTIAIFLIDDKLTIYVTPCGGFLTPDKQKAIAFPVCPSGKDKDKAELKDVDNAKLIKLMDDKKQIKFACGAKIKVTYLAALIGVATQQKSVEVRLDISEKVESTEGIKIIGFVIPAPT